jgi:uncharacterized protein YbjT (DUF2867 family)
MSKILVTGATGTIGHHVVRELLHRGETVRALVHDTELGEPVELAVGDLANTALDQVDRVFLCSGNGPDQATHETTVIDAAATAGVRRLVKISADGARAGSPVHFWDTHAHIEKHLRTSGLPAVVLRPTTYMSNLLANAEPIRHQGKLIAPAGEAKVAMVDPRDVAAVAAITLTEDGHEGRTYTLTGPTAITHHDIAHTLSTTLGRTIEYLDTPDAAARDGMIRAGLPKWMADQIVILWNELRNRPTGPTGPTIIRILTGHEPRTITDFTHDHATAFRTNDTNAISSTST